MKKNLDYFVLLFICSLVFSGLYIMYEHSDKSSYSNSGSAITLRESGFNASVRGRSSHNSAFSSDMIGTTPRSISSNGSHLHVSAPVHSYDHFRGLSTPVASSRSLLSRDVTHGGTNNAHVNLGGAGMSNFMRRSVSVSVAQPNISMPVYVQALKISPYLSAQSRSVSSADVEVARQSFVSSSLGASSFYSSASAYNHYKPSIYAKGITLSREGTLDYGTTYGQRRVGGRPSTGGLGGDGLGDSWLDWLNKTYDKSVNFNNTTAENAYNLWKDEFERNNKGVIPPSYEAWLEWLQSGGLEGYQINGKTYKFPIGDIVPLILIALSYLVMMFVRKR